MDPTTELIPRDILFGNPLRASLRISPDGRYLTYIAPDEQNVQQIWLRTIGQEDDRIITDDKKRGIRFNMWAFDNRHVLYVQDKDGDEDFHTYAVDIQTGEVRDLTPYPRVHTMPIARDPRVPGEMLIQMNLRDPRLHDVYRADLQTGAITLDTENPGPVRQWVADATLTIHAAIISTTDGGSDLLYRETPGHPWRVLRHWTAEEEGHTLAFSLDGRTLYLVANHNANALRVLALDLETGEERTVADDQQYDVGGGWIFDRRTESLLAVSVYKARREWLILDEGITEDLMALAQLDRGDIDVTSTTLDMNTWTVAYDHDNGPITFYLYDSNTKTGTYLFSHRPQLEGLPLAEMQPVNYSARDGLTIHGYLTLPAVEPAENLPAVLLVHGGPWGRDIWDFDSMVQWLANRGYAVLQVNFRGSAGYGKEFLNAGNREWGQAMHDDLIDGVNWLVAREIADPARIGIMGASYGGYATLAGLTFTPDIFACGVDIVGPSNLITLLQNTPPYWLSMQAMLEKRMGNVETEQEFLKSRSPLFFADRITKPLLIGQGANDPRVKQQESDQIVDAMRRHGLPVEYIIFTDEGHGFARPENRLHFYAIAEQFLAKYLGGQCEPMTEAPGHSGVIG